MKNVLGRFSQVMVGAVGGAALLLSGVGMASAHVTIKTDQTAAGSYTILTVGVPHGCEGSPTTRIDISVPEEIETIKPGMNYGWDVEVKRDEAATPAAATPESGEHGESSGRISEIIYTAKTPLPDEFYDQFLLQVKLPSDAEGQTLYFPVVQTCEEGETAWVQIPAEGQSGEELANPAPSVTITAPQDGAGH
ncbi:MAG TPA: YcnI family protein [Thermomicrobiales bacterium]|nr:YcnI family protein [Thermomicrobiales bacterium]